MNSRMPTDHTWPSYLSREKLEKLSGESDHTKNDCVTTDAEDGVEPPSRGYVTHVSATGRPSDQAAASRNYDVYNIGTSESLHCCDSPDSISGDSMSNHVENITPPESLTQANSGGTTPAAQIGRLSLEIQIPNVRWRDPGGHLPSDAAPTSTYKRAASLELQRPPEKQFNTVRKHNEIPSSGSKNPRSRNRVTRGRAFKFKQDLPRHLSGQQNRNPGTPLSTPKVNSSRKTFAQQAVRCEPRDSGYGSRDNTLQCLPPPPGTSAISQASASALPKVASTLNSEVAQPIKGFTFQPLVDAKYPGLILQPDSCPISQDQLAAEVRGIYAGLVMVEAKCMNIDAAQAADSNAELKQEQWQALIALHRTLLYEHHDFLMATQHPSATPSLRGLPTKYSMPARMWRHGIHAFLEVLRHRRPLSQDYMMAFIYLAYQMMSLLFETVPAFTDTWIECLGDLARYRMAIENDKEEHTIWGGVAARWYNTASDRHPNIGRLYHHLGILERPSLRKLYLYSKSLTCVIPFANARDSLATLCASIAQEEHAHQIGNQSAESRVMTFHACHYTAPEDAANVDIASAALSSLNAQIASKLRDTGVLLNVTNIAVLFELGSPTNLLWQLFGNAVNEAIQSARPSAADAVSCVTGIENKSRILPLSGTTAPSLSYDFCYAAFNDLIRPDIDRQSIRDLLPSVHTVLVWLHSIHSLQSRVHDDDGVHTCSSLLAPNRFSWGGLCEFLNTLTQTEPIHARTRAKAHQRTFPLPERTEDSKPLSEDYLIRGLVWTQFYFPSDWFYEQVDWDGRTIETVSTWKARVERVQWLGLYLAFHTDYIEFDAHSRSFRTSTTGTPAPWQTEEGKIFNARQEQYAKASPPKSRSTTTLSAHSDSEGYTLVNAPKGKSAKTWANVAAKPAKIRQNYDDVKVADEDGMLWEY